MEPIVSIIIPCYNAEKWVAEAVQSALDQTWAKKEVIVIDDGSTDRSLDVIKTFAGKIRWETGPNRGGNIARNRGLDLARGDWLQYLDADDYLLPDKVARQIHFLSAHPETDLVFGPVTLEHWADCTSHCELVHIPEPHDPWVLLARWYLPQTGAALWRKQAIMDVDGWKPDQPCCQEHELYLRLLIAGRRFAYCRHTGAVYRQWSEDTVCKRDKDQVRKQRLQIEKRAEDFLRKHGELTPYRQWAINMARFEIARTVWQQDHAEAVRIMEIIRDSEHDFLPCGQAALPAYRLALRIFGFGLTETIADWRRHFLAILRMD